MNAIFVALLAAALAMAPVAQDPTPQPAPAPQPVPQPTPDPQPAPKPAAPQEPAPAPKPVPDGWTEGSGRGPSYRAALAQALEDAVARRRGVAVVRGPGLRSRLAVVAKDVDAKDGVAGDGWFTGEAELEREWVGQQLAGYVESYDVVARNKGADGAHEVTVHAKIAAFVPGQEAFVVELVDDDLRRWRLERYEEGADGEPFAREEGVYEAPSIRENLNATGRIRFVAKSGGVRAGDAADPRERAKAGLQVVPSHRVTVTWQPMLFRSEIERPNRARPTSGPRPQALTAGSVRVAVKVVDLVRDVELLDRALTIELPLAAPAPIERRNDCAVQLGDLAKAAVAETVFFALQPPVVTRKWPAGDGAWHVEVDMPRRVAQAYETFRIGVAGTLASPDWRNLGSAVYVGGADAQCTFRLVDVADAARVEVGVTEVRPARK